MLAGEMPVVMPDSSLSACALFQLEIAHNSTLNVTAKAKATTITRQSKRSFDALFKANSPQSSPVTPISPEGSSSIAVHG